MTLFLLIDTSAEAGLVALLKGDELLAEKIIPNSFQGSKLLLPEIVSLFEKEGLCPQELKFVATGIGPGSYTGIRVAVISAKSFAYTLHIPLVGVCSLEAYLPVEDGTFAVLSDAKIGGAYVLKGEKNHNSIRYDTPQLAPIESIPNLVADVQHLVIPQGNRLPKRLPQLTFIERDPSAQNLGRSAWNKFQSGAISSDTHLDLLYLRKTQAELEREQRTN